MAACPLLESRLPLWACHSARERIPLGLTWVSLQNAFRTHVFSESRLRSPSLVVLKINICQSVWIREGWGWMCNGKLDGAQESEAPPGFPEHRESLKIKVLSFFSLQGFIFVPWTKPCSLLLRTGKTALHCCVSWSTLLPPKVSWCNQFGTTGPFTSCFPPLEYFLGGNFFSEQEK